MSTPEPKAGGDMNAKVNARIALDLLQTTLAHMAPGSPTGDKLKAIVVALASVIGMGDQEKTASLVPSQLRTMMGSLPQTGNMTPGAKAAAANPQPGMNQQPQPVM